MKKRHYTTERNEKIRLSKLGELNPNFGVKEAADHLNVIDHKCEHCGLVTNKGNYRRWHGGNCKYIIT